jgi:hypothetical protein
MKFTPDNFEQLLKEGETIIFIIGATCKFKPLQTANFFS